MKRLMHDNPLLTSVAAMAAVTWPLYAITQLLNNL